MNSFTPDFLKNSAVLIASQFLASNKPLSSGVAEVAVKSSLNNEQIKRLVEVVNQVTYLKLLSTATDRTFEFPLAKYEEVLGIMVSPESSIMSNDQNVSPLAIASGSNQGGLNKEASVSEYEPSDQEKIAYIRSHIFAARNRLEKIAEREVTLLDEISRITAQCKEDEDFMEKAAMVTDGDEDTLNKLAMLVYGATKEWTGESLFYDTELEQAKDTIGLLKEAFDLTDERKKLEASLSKVAFLGGAGIAAGKL
jgi:hypothetical protein